MNDLVCIDGGQTLATIIGGVIAIATTTSSLLANFVKADSFLGKVIHFLAFNFRVTKK